MPQAAPMSSPLAPAAGGNSYTQFMRAPGPSEGLGLGQQPPKAPLPPPGAPRRGIPPIVWIVGGLVLVLIIVIVVVFALRKH
jgi:hypothetical protein